MAVLMFIGGALGVLTIVAGATLLAVAIVIVLNPRWYRRRWGRPSSGPLSSFNTAPFELDQGRKHSTLYFWAGGGAPYDPVPGPDSPVSGADGSNGANA